jgi:hypothetical protein
MNKCYDFIDRLLGMLKGQLNGSRLDQLAAQLQKGASIGVPLAVVLVLVATYTHGNDIMDAVLAALTVIGLGYASYRFEAGCRSAGAGDSSPLSLMVYIDFLMLGCLGACLVFLLQGIDALMSDGLSEGAGMALSMSFGALVLTWTLCNEERLGVRVDTRAGAARDLTSMVSVMLRVCLRACLPLASFVVLLATLMTIVGLATGNDMHVFAGTGLILMGVGIPVGTYCMYVGAATALRLVDNLLARRDA